MSDASPPERSGSAAAALDALRARPRTRRVATLAAVVVGLGLATVHWVWLVVGGAMVGLTRGSLPRALLAGLLFGALALAVSLGPFGFDPSAVLALAPAGYVWLGAGLVLPTFGALARGLG
jgi:hypothetical protein